MKKLKAPDKLMIPIAHFETDEYEILVCAHSAAMYNMNVQVTSVGQYFQCTFFKDDTVTLEQVMPEIAHHSRLKMLEIAMKLRENLRMVNPYGTRN